jgi:TldD protein
VADTPDGVYVAHLGGGQVNTATGDFVFGMTEAYLIEDGRITEPLREGNLIGNGPEVLQLIDAVANDFEFGPPGTCGKDGQGVPVGDGVPTLRVSSLTVGGTAA